jgi:hypothetical protein
VVTVTLAALPPPVSPNRNLGLPMERRAREGCERGLSG